MKKEAPNFFMQFLEETGGGLSISVGRGAALF